MKTAVWLYLFMFVAIFDLHAQYPVLTPFALSLGATPSFIGLIMGMYSATHVPGNILAGYGVDRFGSKLFIVISLLVAGLLLIGQAFVSSPWQLLAIRSFSGFILAFLSPACLSMLARMAKDRTHQGKLMSGNGLVHTLASVVSPGIGALLVAKFGFSNMFILLGWVLIATSLLAIFGIREIKEPRPTKKQSSSEDGNANNQTPWLFYMTPMAISCSQGILFFELPLTEISQASILSSGLLFSVVSIGALVTLSLLFLHQYSPFVRTVAGSFMLALTFFFMAVNLPVPLVIPLFIIGMAKGVIFPAMSTFLATITRSTHYGRVFAMMSISFSIGAFLGPILAGQLRDTISSYYIAFIVLMAAVSILPFCHNPPSTDSRSSLQRPFHSFPGK